MFNYFHFFHAVNIYIVDIYILIIYADEYLIYVFFRFFRVFILPKKNILPTFYIFYKIFHENLCSHFLTKKTKFAALCFMHVF